MVFGAHCDWYLLQAPGDIIALQYTGLNPDMEFSNGYCGCSLTLFINPTENMDQVCHDTKLRRFLAAGRLNTFERSREIAQKQKRKETSTQPILSFFGLNRGRTHGESGSTTSSLRDGNGGSIF